MASGTPRWRLALAWLVVIGAVAFPLVGLWPPGREYYVDWHNHKWLAAYPGEYLRHHASLPVVINTPELAGLPTEVFYGTSLYGLLALLTAWWSPDLTLRLVVVVVTGLEFWLVSRALSGSGVARWQARATACLVIWAIYPLTNLYHRNAIPEFIATGLLTCAVALWFSMAQAPTAAARARRALAFGFVFALMAGTHPITALFSLPFLGLLLVLTLVEHRRDRAYCASLVKQLLLPGGLVVVTLAPWLYALARFQPQLRIAQNIVEVWFYPGLDVWKARFAVLPTDLRVDAASVAQVSTPYLDAQFNYALAALFLGWLLALIWRRRGVTGASLAAAAPYVALAPLFAWMAISPTSYDYLPKSAKLIQIAYRAITYQNLAWLLAVYALARVTARARAKGVDRLSAPVVVVVAALALGATGVVIKLQHLRATSPPRSATVLSAAAERESRLHTPAEFWGAATDYTTPRLFRALDDGERAGLRSATIPIGTDAAFGEPQPLRLDLPAAAWFTTNVQAFPWNHLVLDGAIVPRTELRRDDWRLAVRVPAGGHTLELRTIPDRAWVVLRFVSFWVILSWLAWVLIAGTRAALAKRSAATIAANAGMENR